MGLQKAVTYAQMIDILLFYSFNGDAFYEHNMLTGTKRKITLDIFPIFDELIERYKVNVKDSNGLSVNELIVINQPK